MNKNEFNIINISDLSHIKNNQVCIKYINLPKKKCNKFYEKITKLDNGVYNCPYDFCCIKYNDLLVTSFVSSKSNIKKIYSRYKYMKLKQYHNVYDSQKIYQSLTDYYILKDAYDKYKYYIHDIGNAMMYLMSIKNKLNGNIEPVIDMAKRYAKINDFLNKIRKFSSISQKFAISTDYIMPFLELSSINEKFALYINESYHESLKFKNDYSSMFEKDECFRSYLEGFSLIRTFMEYNLRIHNFDLIEKKQSKINIHKMITKLIRMLEYKSKNNHVTFKINDNNDDFNVFSNNDLFIVFFALLDNAIKYSVEYSQIDVFLSNMDEYLQIIVLNKTLDEKTINIDKIGQKGYRGSTRKPGNGFGIFLAIEIAEISNAKLTVNHVDYTWTSKLIINI